MNLTEIDKYVGGIYFFWGLKTLKKIINNKGKNTNPKDNL